MLDNTPALLDQKFTGYENEPRRLPLKRSGTTIRCVPTGFELGPPPLAEDTDRFAAACVELGIGGDHLVAVPQVDVDGRLVDTVDRVQVGADVIRWLTVAGL